MEYLNPLGEQMLLRKRHWPLDPLNLIWVMPAQGSGRFSYGMAIPFAPEWFFCFLFGSSIQN